MQRRIHLVARLRDEGVLLDERLAQALLDTPREVFVPSEYLDRAYDDEPLPIAAGQTISAPHMVAIMSQALGLHPKHRVLEVGAGSGYHAAVTARLVLPEGHLTTIEWLRPLARQARENLARVGLKNVDVREGDGGLGAPDAGPFDRIYLTCATPRVPAPLFEQAAQDSVVVAPVGDYPARLIRYQRAGGAAWTVEDLGACAFVPMRGEFGR
jgi:protein-L-isoaspartate(D-aspartate) O-methyltransferase